MAEAEVHRAVRSGNLAWLRRVLARNPALVNDQMLVTSATPLHIACHEGQPAMAEELLRWHADVDARDDADETPLHKAVAFRHASLLSAFFLARRCLAAGRVLLDHRANVDARDIHGNTPLHRAAQLGRKPFAELLLRYGANPAVTNERGQIPLRLAVQNNQHQLVELLRRYGDNGLLSPRRE